MKYGVICAMEEEIKLKLNMYAEMLKESAEDCKEEGVINSVHNLQMHNIVFKLLTKHECFITMIIDIFYLLHCGLG